MSDVDEIKSRLNIVDLVGKTVRLKKAGRNFKGLCPFHNEKTPSFIVSPDRQTYHCFGCGNGGDIFSFFMEMHHVDFSEALEDLADAAGVKLSRTADQSGQNAAKEKLYAVNHLASEFYHYMLVKHPLGEHALQYLKNRGISDKSIDTFTLGYSPNSWDALYNYLRKKGYDDALLETAGLVGKQRSYYDRFRGRVMFTLKDHRGNVVGFAGRVLDPAVKEAKYINTSETPVYTKSNVLYGLDVTRNAIQKANEAVLMEGELDVISSFQAGIANAVAIKGTALTEGHVRLLKRFAERVVFALDSDLAGDAASRRGIEIAERAGLDMRVAVMPSGKDPDEAARTHPGLFKKALADAVPMYDYSIDSALQRFDSSTAFGKKKLSEELFPIFSRIENPVVQNHYIKKLALMMGVSEASVVEGMRRVPRISVSGDRVAVHATDAQGTTRTEKLELYLLALILQGDTVQIFEKLQEEGLLPEFTQPAVHRILDLLLSHISPALDVAQTPPVFLVKDFADSLPKELIQTFDEAYLWDLGDLIDSEDAFLLAWQQAIREFRKVILRKRIDGLTRDAAAAADTPDRARAVQQELQKANLELKKLEK